MMKILILAPFPFYRPRGTPIAVDLLARALSERGDRVDVLTFHEGSDRMYEGMRIHRIRPLIPVRSIGIGFSFKKLYCDAHLFFKFLRLIKSGGYDMIHAVEESSFMAMVVYGLLGKPFLYDMDSLMAAQLVNKYPLLKPFTKLLQWVESMPMRHAEAVVAVCDALEQEALRAGARQVIVLKDISLIRKDETDTQEVKLRECVGRSKKIIMYIGNLEPYQGIDLLLESFARAHARIAATVLIIIGGTDAHIRHYSRLASRLGLDEAVHFLGARPVEDIDRYMTQADMLVSPRIEGVNTPMKVYSYLDSGVPVLATALPTHTQVMNNDIAMLAPPDPDAFAQAMITMLEDESLCAVLAENAGRFVELHHSYKAFRTTLHHLYDNLERLVRKPVQVG